MKLLFSCLVPLVFLIGCGKQEISGQVFVVTQGAGNIKLALVEVGAIPLEEFEKFYKEKKEFKEIQKKMLLPKYEAAKKEVDNAFGKLRVGVGITFEKNYKDYLKIEEKNSGIIKEYETFETQEYYLKSLPAAKMTGKSDADGRFLLALPKGKYVIVANSSRKVGDSTESYQWLVKIDVTQSGDLMLSNDNMLDTQCKECIRL